MLALRVLELLLASRLAAAAASTCSATQSCPQSSPCCQSGSCGTGTSCLTGCDPISSYSAEACVAIPICESTNYTFSTGLDRIRSSENWNGDASLVDWVSTGTVVPTSDGNIALTLSESDGGSVLSLARALWYGDVAATFKTGRWAGVVTAYITFSGTKDEIDWEFPGDNTTFGQTNYYFEGNTANYTHGGTATFSDSYSNFHTFGIHWTPTLLSWTVDSVVVRTVLQNSTWNSVTLTYEFPQSPSNIQFGLWAAGEKGEDAGTIEWGGGLVNWTSSDYTPNGYFSIEVQSVNVTCYDQGLGTGSSYVWGANSTLNVPAVFISNASTQIFSIESTGYNLSAGATSADMTATNGTLVGVSASISSSGSRAGEEMGRNGAVLLLLAAFAAQWVV